MGGGLKKVSSALGADAGAEDVAVRRRRSGARRRDHLGGRGRVRAAVPTGYHGYGVRRRRTAD